KTGTVQVELVTGRPAVQPGSWCSPNQYWVPLAVVTRQYWPKTSPLGPPVKRSIREPSSSRGRKAPVASSRISSVALPPRDRIALSVPQQRSPVPAEVSEQAL